MRFLVVLIFFLSVPAFAETVGTISKDGQTISIVDTYSTFDKESNELTVHLLSCEYSENLNVDWQPEYGFLKCFPISENEYFSAPGASLSIKLNGEGKIDRVVFSTTQIGDKENRDYQGFSQSWFRNSPLEGQNVKNGDNIELVASFEIEDKALNVSLNISTLINATIESKQPD